MEIHLLKNSIVRLPDIPLFKGGASFKLFLLSLLLTTLCIFEKAGAQTINNITVSGAPFCEGGDITVKFNAVNGTGIGNYFEASTSYQAYLYNNASAWQILGSPFSISAAYNTGDGAVTADLTKVLSLPSPLPTFSGYRIALVATSPGTTGAIGVNGSAVFTIGGTPAVSIVSNDADNNICSGTSVTFTATPVNGGTSPSYQWYINGSPVGTNSSTFTSSTLVNANEVKVLMTAPSSCPSTATSNSITITVNSSVTPSLNITPTTVNVCSGSSVTFTAGTPTNGGVSPTYQWQTSTNGGSSYIDISGANGNAYTSTSLLNNEMVRVQLTSSATCASPVTVNSNAVSVTVNPNSPASVSITSSDADNTICPGESVTFSAAPTNGGSPSFQWQINGSNVAGATSSTFTTSALTHGQSVRVIMTAAGICASGSPATSNTLTFTVNPALPASVSITSDDADNTICPGTNVTFTASPINGGTPGYQWQLNGANISGATAMNYTTSALTHGQSIRVVMTSTATCAVGTPATSNSIITTVNPNLPASVSITSDDTDNTICAGTSVTFSASPTNGGSPGYQWQLDGANIAGATGASFFTSTLTNGQSIRVVMTSTATCAVGTPATSNSIITAVNPNLPASVSITSNDTDNTICAGTSVTFSASPTNGGSPGYQWQLNGANIVGATSANYTTSALTNGQSIRVLMTSTATCATGTPATSNAIITTVNPNLPASVSILSDDADNTICSGAPVTFTASPTNGGVPSYQWQLNGVNIAGATAVAYSTSTLTNGQSVRVIMTSTATCATGTPATSNAIITTVNPNLPVSVTVSASATTICAGASVTFTASATNAGNSPSFQWRVNGVSQATNLSVFTSSTLNHGDVVTVVLTSDATPCATGNPATSNAITMTVNPNIPVSVAIVSNDADNLICIGTSVTFTATPTNGGTPAYQWKLNGANIAGATSATYTTSALANNDAISVVLTSSVSPCATGNPATSNIIVTSVRQNASISLTSSAPTIAQNICRTTPIANITYNIGGGATNAVLTWNPSAPAGITGTFNAGVYTISGSPTAAVADGTYTYTVTTSGSAPCANTSASGAITVWVGSPANFGNGTPNAIKFYNGSNSVCPAVTGLRYTVAATTNVLEYQWVLPAGFSITSGAGTNDITVAASGFAVTGSHTISVTAVNPCGSNVAKTGTINVGTFAAVNLGPDLSVCTNQPINLNATLQGAAAMITWSAPSGSFDSVNSLTAIYTPAIASGSVVLTATTNNPAGTCNQTSDAITIVIHQQPAITSNPVASQSVCSGGSASFSIAASGTSLSYQWKKDGNDIPGATANVFTLTNVNTGHSGNYTVVVRGGAGCTPVTSSTSVLTVNQVVTITTQPIASQTVCSGGTVALSVNATGTGLTYQWRKNGINIGGETGATLTLANVTSANSGTYSVVVGGTSPCASVTSANAVLTVHDAIVITTQPIATQSLCSGGNASMSVVASGSGLTYQWRKDGVNIPGATQATLTLTNISTTNSAIYTVVVSGTAPCLPVTSSASTLTVSQAVNITTQPTPTQSVCTGSSVSLNVTATGSGLSYQWKKDGIDIPSATAASLNLTSVTSAQAGTYTVVVSGVSPCVPATSANAVVTVYEAVTITAQPAATQTLCSGSNVTFSVSATGSGLTYQWRKDGVTIPGATLSNFTINNITTANSGSYTVVVEGTAPCVPVTSAASVLTVHQAVSISTQPTASQTVCSGSTVNLSVTATGSGLSYQWKKDGVDMPSATSASVTLSNVTSANSGNYTVTVSGVGPCVPVTSASAVVIVHDAVVITTQPVPAQAICSGGTVNFAVSATGTGLAYQWQKNGTDISGATSASFTINNAAVSDGGSYTVVVSGQSPCAALTSAASVLTVSQAVAISSQPVSEVRCTGGSAVFNVTASGTGLTYQWYKGATLLTNGSGIAGATTNTLTINPVANAHAGTDYYVIVTGTAPCAAVTSSSASLSVNEGPSISAQPIASQSVCAGSTAVFSITVTGSGLTYQWRRGTTNLVNGANVSGVNSPTLTISNASSSDAATDYNVMITAVSPCTDIVSQNATLIVNNPVVINTQPANMGVCASNPASFGVVASGTGLTYQWYKGTGAGAPVSNSASISGANTNILNFSQANLADEGVYFVIVSGASPCTPVKSNEVTLNIDESIVITNQPQGATLCENAGSVTFTVTASAGRGVISYQWRKNGSNIPGATGTSYTIPSVTVASGGNYDVVLSGPTSYTCSTVTSAPAVLVVHPFATITSAASNTLCSGTPQSYAITSDVSGATFSWSRATVAGISQTGISGQTATTISEVLTNTTSAPIDVLYSIIPSYSGCTSPAFNYTVTVYPMPSVFAVTNKVACAGAQLNSISFSGATTGAVYTWSNSNTSIGLGAGGIGDIATFTATNTTSLPISSTLTVTPTFTSGSVTCTGSSITFTITVNPLPAVDLVATQTVCSNATTAAINFSGIATSYDWTNSSPSIGLAASGSGSILSFTALNNTTSAITSTLSVTPVFTNAGLTCTGTMQTTSITVNAVPTVNAISNSTICHNTGVASILFTGNMSGASYAWTNSNPAIGLASSGTENIPAFTAINTGGAPITSTIVVTPSFLNNGVQCFGMTQTFTITVNPSPSVNSPSNQVVCNNTGTTAINFSGSVAGAAYAWTNSDNSIGLATSGTGNIASFTAINNSAAIKSATISVVPSFTNNGVSCTTAPIDFTISVNPTATVNAITDQTVCNNTGITAIAISGNVSGAVYNWTNSNTSIGLAASGNGNIPAFTATNMGNSTIVGTITITPVYTNGVACNGTPRSFTITVLPTPTVNTIASQTVCANSSTNAINFTGSVAGSIYNWTNSNTSIGLAASGNTNITSFSATNNGISPVTSALQVTPAYTFSGLTCSGNAQNFNLVVNPLPNVNSVSDQDVCNNVPTATVTLSGTVPGTIFSWTNSHPAVGLAAAGTGNILSFVPVNVSSNIINASLTVNTAFTNAGLTCNGTPVVFALKVAPTSVGGQAMVDGTSPSSNQKTICPAVLPSYTNSISVTVSGYTGSINRWQSSVDGGTIWTDRAGTSSTMTFNNLLVTTSYRAVIKSGGCSETYSQMAIANVIPPYPPAPVTASPSTICAGQTTTLSAQIGYPVTGISDNGGDFNQANPEGWCVDGQCTGSFLPASGDNTNDGPWRETNGPKVFQGVTYDTHDNSKFAITAGIYNSIMETPVFSLVATSAASLDFFQAYKLTAGASVRIEVSTDSGRNYPHVIHAGDGVTSHGVNGSNVAILQHVSIPLNNYFGQNKVRIRFKYVGTAGSSWGVDGIRVLTTNMPNAYLWTDTTSMPTISGTQGNTVTATPYVTTTYMIATTVGNCPGGLQPVTVTVNPGPSISYGQAPPVCQSAGALSTTISISNLVNNPNQYSITWNATPANSFAPVTDAALPAGSITIPIPAGTPAGLYSGSIQVKNANTCFSVPNTFNIRVNPRPLASLADTTTICLGESATFPITLVGSGTFSGTLANGTAFGPTSSNVIPITVSPTTSTTYNLASLTDGTCAALSSGLTGAHRVVVNIPVAISAQPTTNDICLHDNAVITSASTGTIASNQWQVSADHGVTWTDIANGARYSGANSATLTVIDPPLSDIEHIYRNKVSSPPPCNNNLITNTTKLKIRNVWLGTVSTDWQNGANWSHGEPASVICDTTHILNRSNHPTLNSGTSYNTNLLIYPGAYLTLANQPSTFIAIAASTINNGGTFNALDGRVVLNGTIQHQTLTGSTFLNRTLNYLTVANSTATGASLAGAPDTDTLYISNHINFGNVNGRTFTTNSNLTLMSRASRTASVGDLTNNNTNTLNIISGRVTVERYIPSRKAWRYLSVATTGPETFREYWQERNNVANANIYPGYGTTITSGEPSNFAAGGFDTYSLTGPSVKIYNATTNDYDGIPNVWIPMSTPRGLMTFVRGNRSATTFYDPPSSTILRHAGILKQGTQAALPVQANTFTDFGNPYASAIDMRKITKPGVQDVFYIWDPTMYGGFGLGAWKTFTYSNGDYYATPGGGAYGSGPRNFIESQLAFIVRGSTGGNITFEETDKDLSSRQVFRPVRVEQLRATVMIDTTVMDGVLVDYGNWSNNVDYDDAIKLRNNSENVGISRGGKILSVERRSTVTSEDTVFLRFTGTRIQNNYKWAIELKNMDTAGRTAFLLDNYLKTSTPLDLNGTTMYTFSVAHIPGTYEPERFKIIFKQQNALIITHIDAKRNNDNTVKVNWAVENEGEVYTYTTERSFDGDQFAGIISTSSSSIAQGDAAYTVNDLGASLSQNYYRIKGISANGHEVTSQVVKVTEVPVAAQKEISVYPNPIVGRTISVHFKNQVPGAYQLRLLSQDGKVMQVKSAALMHKAETVKFTTGFVSAGTYLLEVIPPAGDRSLLTIFIQ